MSGRNHIIVNSIIGATAAVVCFTFSKELPIVGYGDLIYRISSKLSSFLMFINPVRGNMQWLLWIAYMVLFFIGTLFPDIDNRKSMLGKIFYLPVKHRTWTHTIWIVILLAFISSKVYWMFYFTAGYFLHVFVDAGSYSGICWLYPLSQYREYASGAKVKKGKHLKLYRVGKPSEGVYLSVIFMLCICLIVLCLNKGGYLDILQKYLP